MPLSAEVTRSADKSRTGLPDWSVTEELPDSGANVHISCCSDGLIARASGLCTFDDAAPEPRFFITAMVVYWLRDPLTRVNAEFSHHVCFKGAFHLRESLLEGRPAGLPEIDQTGAATVYEALRSLSPEVKKAWFEFDHHYSDGVFELCLPRVLSGSAPHVVDVGGNTGRFARLTSSTARHA